MSRISVCLRCLSILPLTLLLSSGTIATYSEEASAGIIFGRARSGRPAIFPRLRQRILMNHHYRHNPGLNPRLNPGRNHSCPQCGGGKSEAPAPRGFDPGGTPDFGGSERASAPNPGGFDSAGNLGGKDAFKTPFDHANPTPNGGVSPYQFDEMQPKGDSFADGGFSGSSPAAAGTRSGQPSTASGLIPANTNGNPAFGYSVIGPGYNEQCQATLIKAEGGICMAATASHCLTGAIERNGSRRDPSTGAVVTQAKVNMPDFGQVQATLYVNPEYLSQTKSEDSAVFSWSCRGPGSVPVVPVDASGLREGESVAYGKVMGGKQGLYLGKIFREPGVVGINGRSIGEAQESVMQNPQFQIQQGDSGGPLLRKGADGKYRLVGVLSTSDDIRRKRPIGNYATNRSLNFIRRITDRFLLAQN